MAPILYSFPWSPPVRAVQITAKALNIHLQEKVLDVSAKDHLASEYLELNPQHTAPLFTDEDGFTVWDSHAINVYLVSKYSKNHSLYPKDLEKRAVVDQRLHFDTGVAFAVCRRIAIEVLTGEKPAIDDADRKEVEKIYAFLEAFLEDKKWICGDSLTLADYHLYTSVTALNVLAELDERGFPLVATWLRKVNALEEVEVSRPGLAIFASMVESKLNGV